ncbi:hypothetical protein B0T10DRAFT_485084 [Thelonectria olida]|uniref:Uncharacterized protein n=1 Tax=Thelonectria olida TaxID=1576542 RepID=A0A9P9AN75_9HYPO|nr:hypothetical protein B0T10DRAFT_485084 [Thelonectria olida]
MSSTFGTPDTEDGGDGFSGRTVAWVLIPLVVIILIGLAATVVQIRRRRLRRQGVTWPGAPGNMQSTGGRILVVRRGGRNGTRSETARMEEGLNELGEAPPPYEGKKEGRQEDGTELQYIESNDPSPAYPSPAVTTQTPRHV